VAEVVETNARGEKREQTKCVVRRKKSALDYLCQVLGKAPATLMLLIDL